MNKPKISIILPIFKTENYLKRCIDSIINQTLSDIEIILATDGPEECNKICDEYSSIDNRIKVIYDPGSYGKAFNKSLEIAQGEYIGIVETDDWCDLTMFEKLYKKAQITDADVVKCGFYFAFDDSNKNFKVLHKNYNNNMNVFKQQDFLSSQPSVWSCIYKKEFLLKNNIKMIEDKMSFIDSPFHYETLYKAKNYQLLKEPLYFYYQDNPNQTVKCVKPLDGLNAEKYAYDKIVAEKELFAKIKEGFIFATALHLHWNYTRLCKKDIQIFWTLASDYVGNLNLDNIKYKYFSQNLKEFFFELRFCTYKEKLKKDKKRQRKNNLKKLANNIFSLKNEGNRKILTILGLKIKAKNKLRELEYKLHEIINQNNEMVLNALKKETSEFKTKVTSLQSENKQLKIDLFYLMLNNLKPDYNKFLNNFSKFQNILCSFYIEKEQKYLPLLFPDAKLTNDINENFDYVFLWGTRYFDGNYECLKLSNLLNKPVLILEDGFLKSINTWIDENLDIKWRRGFSYTINSPVPYFDATRPSGLELMLNDKNLVISEDQKIRARKCIDKITSTHLTKYNHQPIYTPNIGRKGVKKVLVVDQSYGDMSISKGLANDSTFENMLNTAIQQNPDADIIVKTHPDTIAGAGGYYKNLKAHDNIYLQTEAINPISLIKYCDKVYVATTQLGFEALMCEKEVHVFGMPFYAGWGLTNDAQKCERRENKRSLEEIFYIAYIMYSYYVNPEKESRCEIEEAMDYLLKLRDEYFNEYKIRNDRKVLTNE